MAAAVGLPQVISWNTRETQQVLLRPSVAQLPTSIPAQIRAFHSTSRSLRICSSQRTVTGALAEGQASTGGEAAEVYEEEVEYVGNDELILYFKAEGILSEAAIPRVTKALQACEGVDNVRVSVLEGCATAECTKATSVQAAAVSSSILEALQAAGFGLQTVSLGFSDDGSESAAELFSLYTAEGGDLSETVAVAAQ